ncbi:MAG TPA: hypothetical protein DDW96_04095 [Synergistaceae bacterium]|nr:hypothetical protein [Synergistaceae bacterium]
MTGGSSALPSFTLSEGTQETAGPLSCYPSIMRKGPFVLEESTELRKRAGELSLLADTPEIRQDWLLIAEEASREGDWLLSEYAYRKGLGLQVLW